MEVAKHPGARFVGGTLERSDQIVLMLFAEQVCRLYQELTERHYGRPIACELVDEIEAIIRRAEFQAKAEALQILSEVEAA